MKKKFETTLFLGLRKSKHCSLRSSITTLYEKKSPQRFSKFIIITELGRDGGTVISHKEGAVTKSRLGVVHSTGRCSLTWAILRPHRAWFQLFWS